MRAGRGRRAVGRGRKGSGQGRQSSVVDTVDSILLAGGFSAIQR
jgi:hypothetical protein